LDANEGIEILLDDEEALCLDATTHGNIVKILNHECHDANLVDILFQIEIDARHLYHVCVNLH
jgi:ABC-type dipeptide/oligopeptide/nickel transport system ATPase subunit